MYACGGKRVRSEKEKRRNVSFSDRMILAASERAGTRCRLGPVEGATWVETGVIL